MIMVKSFVALSSLYPLVYMLGIHLIMVESSHICRISEQLVLIIAYGEMPAPGPDGDGPFRSVCVRSE